MNNQPIGILDSGVGGLSIWKEIVKQLPQESTIYIGDSKNAPYGKRNPEEIVLLASKLLEFLKKKKVKLIVIACNTITVNGIGQLRLQFPDIPIIGTVPVIKGGANISKTKRIGLLATTASIQSIYVKELIKTFASNCQVMLVGTDQLVPLIESGAKSPSLKKVLQKQLEPFKKALVDTVILGSTHFPFIRQEIQDIMGEKVVLLDSGAAIARQVSRVLKQNNALSESKKPDYTFFTTGDKKQFEKVFVRLMGYNKANIYDAGF